MKIMPLDVCDVSSQNKYEIIKYLLSCAPHSRNDAADAISLSSVTVGKIASSMLCRNILIGERETGARGRSTELLCASPSLSVLSIGFWGTSMSASFVTLSGIEKTILKHLRNDSFDYAEDMCVFLASVQRKIANMTDADIIGVFVTYSDKSPKQLGVDVGMLLGIEPDVIISAEEALGIAFGHRKECEIALHISIDYNVKARLFVNGMNISKNACRYTPAEQNEYAIALELARYLAELFKTVIPDSIAIDSETVTADKRFFELISNEASRTAKLEADSFPAIIYQRNIRLTSEAALNVILELYAKKLAGIN